MDRKVNPSVAETVASASLMGGPLGSEADDISRVTSSAEDEGRFVPGTLLGGRYRIIGLLGRGGMGEVYRATDLTLGQSVALKFLPEEASRNQRLLERFHGEVRVARLVSHPNVCRVYDIGEVEGCRSSPWSMWTARISLPCSCASGDCPPARPWRRPASSARD
jgi:serine/threonine-protein kinase